jgi:hypothetical protein
MADGDARGRAAAPQRTEGRMSICADMIGGDSVTTGPGCRRETTPRSSGRPRRGKDLNANGHGVSATPENVSRCRHDRFPRLLSPRARGIRSALRATFTVMHGNELERRGETPANEPVRRCVRLARARIEGATIIPSSVPAIEPMGRHFWRCNTAQARREGDMNQSSRYRLAIRLAQV